MPSPTEVIERLTAIRKHHADAPCGVYSAKDECFLLGYVDRMLDTNHDLVDQIATLHDDSQALTEAREQLTTLQASLATVREDRDRLQKMSEAAFYEGRASAYVEAVVEIRRLATDLLETNGLGTLEEEKDK